MKKKNPYFNSKFSELYKNKNMSDVCFFKGDIQIPAHKLILGASSCVFEKMFYGKFASVDKILIDESIESFSEFLQLFYLAEVEITPECIQDVITLVDKYNVKDCMTFCEEIFKQLVTNESICSFLETALMINLSTNTIEFLESKISREIKEVVKTDGFKTCSRAVFKGILSINELECDETTIFHSALEWATTECIRLGLVEDIVNKKKLLGDCLNLIRFPVMSATQFLDCLEPYPTIIPSDECFDILQYITSRRPMKIASKYSTDIRERNVFVVFEDLDIVNSTSPNIFEFTVDFKQAVELTQFSLGLFKSNDDQYFTMSFSVERGLSSNSITTIEKTVSITHFEPKRSFEDGEFGIFTFPIDPIQMENNAKYRFKFSSSSSCFRCAYHYSGHPKTIATQYGNIYVKNNFSPNGVSFIYSQCNIYSNIAKIGIKKTAENSTLDITEPKLKRPRFDYANYVNNI